MLNYPFPSPPVFYSNYKFDINLRIINKVLFQTVLIGYKTDKILNLICYGILFPVFSALTTFIGYKVLRVAWIKHVRKLETTFVCYAFIEAVLMQLISTCFTLFYWTWGAVENEEDLGTSKFVCIFYLYFFNYLPQFCFNLVNCTISILLITYYRKQHTHLCGIKLTNFNIRTFYVIVMNVALCDVLFIFCISWIAMAKADEGKNYQTKCFVLLNPIFQRFEIVNWVKGMEWHTQILIHSLPYALCIAYMVFALLKIFNYHLIRRRGIGIFTGEKQHYGGCALTLAVTAIFLILDMFFNLFCDIYEISLHVSSSPTNAEFFFSLKNCKTVMRTIYCLIAPFQLLAICSLNPHFQSTMVRYLNGTEKFDVKTETTLGGEKRTKVNYEPLPEPSKMTWLAWCYFKWCRCYFAVRLFRKFLDTYEETARNRRQGKRQRKLNKEIDKERKVIIATYNQRELILHDAIQNETIQFQPAQRQPSRESFLKSDTRIQIEFDGVAERVSIVSSPSFQIFETAV